MPAASHGKVDLMGPAVGGAVAATFVWLGMVLAISFIEAPLKFRAPGVTLPIGLGIGRLVFRVLNRCELVLAGVVVLAVAVSRPGLWTAGLAWAAAATLVCQLLLVRPRLALRSDAILAGHDRARSQAHLWYVGLELIKVVALVVSGIGLLAVGT